MLTSVDDPVFWDNLYEKGEANWDLKSPNPVFTSLLKDGIIAKPCRLLITGSGKGYDAIEAAKRGYDVTAVDFSSNAISFAKELARRENMKVNFILSDIFELCNLEAEKFDAVYEYTTFCAINPSRREEFAEEISCLLKPGGRFIALVFPIDGRRGGPPFNIDIIEFYKIFSLHFKLEYSTRTISSVKPRKHKEILQVYVKPEQKD